MTLPLIPHDKANHFVYGAVTCALVVLTTKQPTAGILAAVVLGVVKEVYDLATKTGTPDWRDAVWTAAGGACVWLGDV